MSGVGESDAMVLEVVYRDRKEEIVHDQTRKQELIEKIEKARLELKELSSASDRLQSEANFVQHYANSIVDVESKKSKEVEHLTKKDTLENVSKFLGFYKKQLSRVDDDAYKLTNQINGMIDHN